MKKILLFVMTIMLTLSLAGCGVSDATPATAEITTSTGEAYVVNSVNGAGYGKSGATRAVLLANEVAIELPAGGTATIHFFCTACGYDETETLEAPCAKMFSCNCPENIDDNGNAREYLSVEIGAVEGG